jgi:hypothetical protein
MASLPHTTRLLQAFAAIPDKKIRLALVRLAEGLRKRAK